MKRNINGGGPIRGLLFVALRLPRFGGLRARLVHLACALLLVALAVFPGATFAAAPGRIVLVTIDGLPAGAEKQADRMPTLARLAREGMSCTQACSPAPLPFPAWAELLTGCGPDRTLVRDEITCGLGATTPTLAATLRTLGYRGLGLPGDPLAHAASGLARGFDRYSPVSPALEDSARVDSALVWLATPGRRFVWLSLSFGAPAESWRRVDGIGPRDPARFAARARELDAALARLARGLERAGLPGTTIMAITGTGSVPGASTSVPVVFSGPVARWRGGSEIPGSASLADVAPTLVAAAGGRPAGLDGIDLAAGPRRTKAACSTVAAKPDPLAVPDSCSAQLFAWIAPGTGMADSVQLAKWDSLVARYPGHLRVALERDVAASRAGRETAAALGLKNAMTALPGDPRPVMAYTEHLVRHERSDLVAEVVTPIAGDNPYAALADWRLAFGYAGQEDFIAAEGAARRAVSKACPTAASLSAPAAFHRFGILRDSTAQLPMDPAMHIRYGRALGDFGFFRPAYVQFHAARGVASAKDGEPDYWLAVYLERQGRPQHAVPTLLRSLTAQPDYVPARLALADLYLKMGSRREAREQLERVQGSLGSDSRALYNLACLRATDGEIPGALEALERAMAAGYADAASLASDPDLDSLRSQPRFRALLESRPR
jgi:tetratricopeptide (TPR) repeat protein